MGQTDENPNSFHPNTQVPQSLPSAQAPVIGQPPQVSHMSMGGGSAPPAVPVKYNVQDNTLHPSAPAPGQQFPENNTYQPQLEPKPLAYGHPAGEQNIHQVPQTMNSQGDWTTGLFDCCDDPCNALVTTILPCLTFGQVAEILENGTQSCGACALLYCCITYLIGCPCLLSCTYRTKLRARYQLTESCPDCLVHCFCECCALCQAYRELKN